MDFNDGVTPIANFKENYTRLGPIYPDIHYIKHSYDVPGNYVASISVENIFGRTEVDSVDVVVVQNSLRHKFILAPDDIDPVPYPPGTVSFNSQLVKNASHTFTSLESIPSSGWANNVHAQWFLSRSESNFLLRQSYGDRDLGKFDVCFGIRTSC